MLPLRLVERFSREKLGRLPSGSRSAHCGSSISDRTFAGGVVWLGGMVWMLEVMLLFVFWIQNTDVYIYIYPFRVEKNRPEFT